MNIDLQQHAPTGPRLGPFLSLSLALLATASINLLSGTAALSEEPIAKWRGWGEFGGYFGSDNASRGEVAIFAPLLQNGTSLLFTDVRGKLFEDNAREGNAALGYRHMLSPGWNLGVWAGLDIRNSVHGNTFWQAAGGIEALSEVWDLRINGYLPLSNSKSAPGMATVLLSGNSILMTGVEEIPLYGIVR
ncbi:inverse autotransporter beta domain-containing protein [Roseibium sp.]|uniref:inverse autotransporter beta domain-containing protein n=1 Tax=Roseibium sp. TaxID=1936156 RepID=UPI003A96C25A